MCFVNDADAAQIALYVCLPSIATYKQRLHERLLEKTMRNFRREVIYLILLSIAQHISIRDHYVETSPSPLFYGMTSCFRIADIFANLGFVY